MTAAWYACFLCVPRAGDTISSVNEAAVEGFRHKEIVQLIRACGNTIRYGLTENGKHTGCSEMSWLLNGVSIQLNLDTKHFFKLFRRWNGNLKVVYNWNNDFQIKYLYQPKVSISGEVCVLLVVNATKTCS